MTGQRPKIFNQLNPTERLMASLFAKVGNAEQLKIPLQKSANNEGTINVDQRVGGFGHYFGGIVILTLLFWILHYKKFYKKEFFGLFFLVFGTILLNPENWWARYVPQIWFLPFIIIGFSYVFLPKIFESFLRAIILLFLSLSVYDGFVAYKNQIGYTNTILGIINHTKSQLDETKNLVLLYFDTKMELSVAIKFKDRDINTKIITKEEFENYKNQNISFETIKTLNGIAYKAVVAK